MLVNEYGLVGLDAALIGASQNPEGSGPVEIREVAGGCICCSAGLIFEVSLVRLLRRRPDRLLIEPTGLAALAGILNALDRPGIREAVDVRSVICLLDPRRFEDDLQREEVRDQVEAADVLLASRRDLGTAEQVAAFESWAKSLFPPKRHVGAIERGRIPVSLLDLVRDRGPITVRGGHAHGTDHPHEHSPDEPTPGEAGGDSGSDDPRPIVLRTHRSTMTSTVGWICRRDLVFHAEAASRWLETLAALPGARRAKAVLHTTEGWWSFNIADGEQDLHPSGYRRDSRIEIVLEGDAFPSAEALERQLHGCLASDVPTPRHPPC